MEMVFIIIVPFVLLMAGASFLVVAQVSGFLQSGSLNRRQHFSNQLIQQNMIQIAMAQSQIAQRSTELEVLSSKLVFSNQELGRLNEMKSKFLSMVVHDVRTPLASIRGFSELLLKKSIGAKEEQYLKNIVLSTDQLGHLISDLTDLAMIEAGKLKMEKARIDFVNIARDIIPGISVNAQKKGVDLVVGGTLPSDLMVNGDRFRLSQVLMNLLNNAIKFTPVGKQVELTIRSEGRYD